MNVNADFSKKIVMHGDTLPWEPTPMPGVERRRLDRVATEPDRVTTIVRYAPNSQFSEHVHSGGEEFIVLDGVFQDDYGDWPEGSYIRNPPLSKHTPGSKPGCTIFVKLQQFAKTDRTFIHANRFKLGQIADRTRDSVGVSPLFEDERESVRFEYWDANSTVEIDAAGGAEVFVLEGSVSECGDTLTRHGWLRAPLHSQLTFQTGDAGATVWVKTGHLRFT